MSIQDISISNNQHKKLINAVPDDRILVEGDDGELIVNVSEYKSSKLATKGKIIELIIGDEVLDPNAQYWVFK
jgi:Tat protein secretion system quality control protein TatD with DNase activity